MLTNSTLVPSLVLLSLALVESRALADGDPTGAPPPEAKAIVVEKKGADAPKIEAPKDGTSIAFAAGGLWATGNSRSLSMSANGLFDKRFGKNAIGASIVGNYGQGAPLGSPIVATTENLQGRIRYDRYLFERGALFLIATGRHDRFQGLDFRLNLDPGFKFLFVNDVPTKLWAEAGYDFQYDIRRDDARGILDANGKPVLDAGGNPTLLDKTNVDHSTRLFLGLRHSFNEQVTFTAGAEYLQSVVDTNKARINFEALFAAKVGAGFAVGLGFSARYDHAPLPGKETVDTTTTVNLIYAFETKTPPAPEADPTPLPAVQPVAPAAPATP